MQYKDRPELKIIKQLGLDDKALQQEQVRIEEARRIDEARRQRWRASMQKLAREKEGADLREILELFVVMDVYNNDEKRMLINEGQRSLAKYLLSMME